MSQIEIRNITKTYRINGTEIKAVNDASLNVEKGDFLSIMGHSGSGKTTLLSIMGGIMRQSSGSIFFNGTNISKLNDNGLSQYRAENVGYIFQFASLLPALTVKENLLLPTIFKKNTIKNGKKKIENYLHMVGLGDKINAYPSQLSGGQQRRVAIARSLMNNPDLILADEPTGDLDEETEKEVMDVFKSINREKQITFILVTHCSDLAAEASRKLKMHNGQLNEI